MSTIRVNNIRLHAFHGCQPEEALIGGEFIVDVSIDYDFREAAETDNIEKTINYVTINAIVRTEMAIRSNLIENVLHRIVASLKRNLPAADKILARVTKVSPPMYGQVESVSVETDL